MQYSNSRFCGDCSACCEGWLHGSAHGYQFWPSRKCHFLGSNGCSIYENRPDSPCKSFKCLWLTGENDTPQWMKPNDCGVILSYQSVKGITYILATETGKQLNVEVLSWLIMEHVNGRLGNFCYQLNGGMNYYGDKLFLDAVNSA